MAFLVGLNCTPSTFLFDVSKLVFFDFFNETQVETYAGLELGNVSDDFVAACFLLPLVMALLVTILVHCLGFCACVICSFPLTTARFFPSNIHHCCHSSSHAIDSIHCRWRCDTQF